WDRAEVPLRARIPIPAPLTKTLSPLARTTSKIGFRHPAQTGCNRRLRLRPIAFQRRHGFVRSKGYAAWSPFPEDRGSPAVGAIPWCCDEWWQSPPGSSPPRALDPAHPMIEQIELARLR